MVDEAGGRRSGPAERHAALLRRLGLPQWCQDMAAARLAPPIASLSSPPAWRGWPPALIPFWTEDDTATGLWLHAFSPRPASFARVRMGAGHRVEEIARTPAQFAIACVVDALVARDGVDAAVAGFARAVGVTDLAAIDALTLATGDDPRGLAALPEFRADAPRSTLADDAGYDGWFPVAPSPSRLPWWRHACALELVDADGALRLPAALPGDEPLPPWLARSERRAAFDAALAAGGLAAAWLALHGPGWTLPEARDAIRRLDAAAGDPAFSARCAAWLATGDGRSGGW